MTEFHPHPSLVDTPPHPSCRAVVIVPARNEEAALPASLDALRHQVDPSTRTPAQSLDPNLYEVIVLLNNCTDASASAVRRYQQAHPTCHLHLAERTFPPEIAHVGTARRMLMDTAYHRLRESPHRHAAILSTDADTTVAPDWIARNLHAVEAGAEVVGGTIHLNPHEIRHLDPGTLHAYRQDQRYQRSVAHLESLLDPDPSDPWPRHLDHFGASLACTPAIYRRAGGLPPVKPLEDVAFINSLRRVGARIRHAPEVSIVTSARLHGRADVGLSGQLRRWQEDAAANRSHLVQSAAWLTHRFSSLAHLREIWALSTLPSHPTYSSLWQEPLEDFHHLHLSQHDFLAAIDCNRLIEQTFHGPREGQIHRVIADLTRAITRAQAPATTAPAHLAETSPAAANAQFATQAV